MADLSQEYMEVKLGVFFSPIVSDDLQLQYGAAQHFLISEVALNHQNWKQQQEWNKHRYARVEGNFF